MDEIIRHELILGKMSFLFGVAVTAGYDVIRVLRRLFSHNNFWIAVEDVIFWILCSVGTFLFLQNYNRGMIRYTMVMAAGVGMILYHYLLGKYLVKYLTLILNRFGKFIQKWKCVLTMRIKRFMIKLCKRAYDCLRSNRQERNTVNEKRSCISKREK